MTQEIINYPFDPELDNDLEDSNSFGQTSEVSTESRDANDAAITYVNGHNLPDEDEEDEDEDEDENAGDDLPTQS